MSIGAEQREVRDMRKPCLTCSELTDQGSRCETCQRAWERIGDRARVNRSRPSRNKGYNSQWDRLSRRARELQKFCGHCGSTEDLQADHKPQAWERKERGLTVRLQDVQVLCGRCNRAAGEARPGSPRALAAARRARPGARRRR